MTAVTRRAARRRRAWPALGQLHTIIFDFDGVFTDNRVYVSEDGRESVCCNRADGLGLDLLRRHAAKQGKNLDLLIVSTETNPVVLARANKLRLPCHHGVGNKLSLVQEYFDQHRPADPHPYAGLLMAGNDLNDLPILERAAYSVVPQDAHPLVKRIATFVLPERGGDGFVRAIVERLLAIPTLTLEVVRELVSDR